MENTSAVKQNLDYGYDLQWESGDLGLSLRPNGKRVEVSRITGKGSPIGLCHVSSSDILTTCTTTGESNEIYDITNMEPSSVFELLKTLNPPLTLRFKTSVNNDSYYHSLIKSGEFDSTCSINNAGDDTLDSKTKQSLLQTAIRHNQKEAFNALVISQSNMINHQDINGNTALHFAVTKSLEFVKKLLDANANPHLANKHGLKPLNAYILTCKRANVTLVSVLCNAMTASRGPLAEANVLHQALDRRLNLDVIKVLISSGTSLSIPNTSDNATAFDKIQSPADLKNALSSIRYTPLRVCDTCPTRKKDCMACKKPIKKIVSCAHCGRSCCVDCTRMKVEAIYFPTCFPNRYLPRMQPNFEKKNVCKTCYRILCDRKRTERGIEEEKKLSLYDKTFGMKWKKFNPTTGVRVRNNSSRTAY